MQWARAHGERVLKEQEEELRKKREAYQKGIEDYLNDDWQYLLHLGTAEEALFKTPRPNPKDTCALPARFTINADSIAKETKNWTVGTHAKEPSTSSTAPAMPKAKKPKTQGHAPCM